MLTALEFAELQGRVQRGHHWAWGSDSEKVATERILDDGGQRWRNYENNPTIATWCNTYGQPQATLKIHRSYSRITKAQVYYGRHGFDHCTCPASTGIQSRLPACLQQNQNLARQRDTLEPLGIDRWYSDQIPVRSRADRPGLEDCLDYLRNGDELHVASVDRLARSLIDLKQLIAQLADKGVSVVFHRENLRFSADKASPTADLILGILGILGSFAEFERSIIRERQAEGIVLDKKAGKYTGRPKTMSEEKSAQARRRVAAGEKKTAVAEDMGVSRSTLSRHLS